MGWLNLYTCINIYCISFYIYYRDGSHQISTRIENSGDRRSSSASDTKRRTHWLRCEVGRDIFNMSQNNLDMHETNYSIYIYIYPNLILKFPNVFPNHQERTVLFPRSWICPKVERRLGSVEVEQQKICWEHLADRSQSGMRSRWSWVYHHVHHVPS